MSNFESGPGDWWGWDKDDSDVPKQPTVDSAKKPAKKKRKDSRSVESTPASSRFELPLHDGRDVMFMIGGGARPIITPEAPRSVEEPDIRPAVSPIPAREPHPYTPDQEYPATSQRRVGTTPITPRSVETTFLEGALDKDDYEEESHRSIPWGKITIGAAATALVLYGFSNTPVVRKPIDVASSMFGAGTSAPAETETTEPTIQHDEEIILPPSNVEATPLDSEPKTTDGEPDKDGQPNSDEPKAGSGTEPPLESQVTKLPDMNLKIATMNVDEVRATTFGEFIESNASFNLIGLQSVSGSEKLDSYADNLGKQYAVVPEKWYGEKRQSLSETSMIIDTNVFKVRSTGSISVPGEDGGLSDLSLSYPYAVATHTKSKQDVLIVNVDLTNKLPRSTVRENPRLDRQGFKTRERQIQLVQERVTALVKKHDGPIQVILTGEMGMATGDSMPKGEESPYCLWSEPTDGITLVNMKNVERDSFESGCDTPVVNKQRQIYTTLPGGNRSVESAVYFTDMDAAKGEDIVALMAEMTSEGIMSSADRQKAKGGVDD
jgi:hypothetical protein